MIIQQFVREMDTFNVNYYFYLDRNNEPYLFLTDLPQEIYHKLLFKRYTEFDSIKVEKVRCGHEEPLLDDGSKYTSFVEKQYRYFIKYIFKHTDLSRDISKDGKNNLAIHLDQEYYLKKLCTVSHIIREYFFSNNTNYMGF